MPKIENTVSELSEYWRLWAEKLWRTSSFSLIEEQVTKALYEPHHEKPNTFLTRLMVAIHTNSLDAVHIELADTLGKTEEAVRIRESVRRRKLRN